MKILSIDTSCDDTSISIVSTPKKGCFTILSNIVSSQEKLHQEYGGVYPSLAKREHQKNLVPVLQKALKGAKLLSEVRGVKGAKLLLKFKKLSEILEREPELYKKLEKFLKKYKKPNIDAIAVTVGPGLEPCLWVGINFARALEHYWGIPVIQINHIEGHVLINFLNNDVKLPAIALIVSGGHTQIILVKKIGKYEIIGETRDDAAGECFDKTARILGLPYPGGPEIARMASDSNKTSTQVITMPRPMLHTKDYDLSFSGLKTAVLYDFKKRTKKQKGSKAYKIAMAKEIQQSIIDVLIKKTLKATRDHGAKTVILGGGVSANKELKRQFKKNIKKQLPKVQFLAPIPKLSTDNAVMIAITALLNKNNKKGVKAIKAQGNLRI